jgi:hypothetical protein
MLAEFKYGLEPKETFQRYFDQAEPTRSVDSWIPAFDGLHFANHKYPQTFLSPQKGILQIDYVGYVH